MDRALLWPACRNVRDLGGLVTLDGKRTCAKALVRADNLLKLTADGRLALLDHSVRTVLDLRGPAELERFPNPFAHDPAVRYRSAPLISAANWKAIAEGTRPPHEADVLTLELSAANIASVMSEIAGAASGGVVFHCNAGLERTGLVAMLLLGLAGVPDEDVAADYVMSATCLRPLFDEWLAARVETRRGSLAAWIAQVSDPSHVVNTLNYLRARGGVRRYLKSSGVPERDLERLRARLV